MMRKIINPATQDWPALCSRPELPIDDLEDLAKQVFKEIAQKGDWAVHKYTNLFDGMAPQKLVLTKEDIGNGAAQVPGELRRAISMAKENIEAFHSSQIENKKIIETAPGVECWRESRAIESVGLYIPGGSAPLFSTVLMLGIPAKIAGCREIIMCTPPDKNGGVDSAVLFAAQLIGISRIYCIGGIQAIAAMALGTQTVPKVMKIFGPGNQFVTAAKHLATSYGVAIDLPAGPSELLVIADHTANPDYLAADLLSQAEHGPDSQVTLVSDTKDIISATLKAIAVQVEKLPRKKIVSRALKNSKAIYFKTLEECIAFSNMYAPEHLILSCDDAEKVADTVVNAGSVFLGNYSCESAGDYASGTNHTLPTNGYAKNHSGVSLDSFIRKISFQKITAEGLLNIGPCIERMAEAEHLEGHKNAVTIRLKDLAYDANR
jgi:histidinol dehydrogenase